MKKNLAIAIVVLTGLIGIIGFIALVNRKEKKLVTSLKPTSFPQEVPLEVAVENRPYVRLLPTADGHWVTLIIENIKFTGTLEYEITYEMTSGEGERLGQGIIGHTFLTGTNYNSGKRLLGTESSGKFKFDKDVQGKKILLRFRDGNKVVKFETDWRLWRSTDKITSADGNVAVVGNLPSNNFYIVMSSIGLPKMPLEKVVGGPYHIATSGSNVLTKPITLIINLPDDGKTVKVLSWNENTESWESITRNFKREVEKISVEVVKLGTFVVVNP